MVTYGPQAIYFEAIVCQTT